MNRRSGGCSTGKSFRFVRAYAELLHCSRVGPPETSPHPHRYQSPNDRFVRFQRQRPQILLRRQETRNPTGWDIIHDSIPCRTCAVRCRCSRPENEHPPQLQSCAFCFVFRVESARTYWSQTWHDEEMFQDRQGRAEICCGSVIRWVCAKPVGIHSRTVFPIFSDTTL